MNPFEAAAAKAAQDKSLAQEKFLEEKAFRWYENRHDRYELKDGKIWDKLRTRFVEDDLLDKLNRLNNLNCLVIRLLKFSAFNFAWSMRMVKENFDKLGIPTNEQKRANDMNKFYEDVWEIDRKYESGKI